MIRILNLVNQDSKSKGWTVDIDTKDESNKKYTLKLSGVESRISFNIDPMDYMDLTLPGGMNTRAYCKLNNNDVSTLKSADEDTDQTIIFICFETEPGEAIVGLNLVNGIVIDYEITEIENLRNRLVLAAIGVAKEDIPTDINISYGFIGGRSLTTRTIKYHSRGKEIAIPDLYLDTEKVDIITKNDINIPTIISMKG